MLAQLGISFGEMLGKTGVIVGIILAILGVVLAVLAVRLTRAIRKAEEYDPNDKLVLIFKVVGLVLILVGFVTMALSSLTV